MLLFKRDEDEVIFFQTKIFAWKSFETRFISILSISFCPLILLLFDQRPLLLRFSCKEHQSERKRVRSLSLPHYSP